MFVSSFIDDLPYIVDVEICMECVVWYKPGGICYSSEDFFCDRCVVATLDLLAHPYSSIPYVQMGLVTVLYTSNLFSNDKVEFLPISQLISFAF